MQIISVAHPEELEHVAAYLLAKRSNLFWRQC